MERGFSHYSPDIMMIEVMNWVMVGEVSQDTVPPYIFAFKMPDQEAEAQVLVNKQAEYWAIIAEMLKDVGNISYIIRKKLGEPGPIAKFSIISQSEAAVCKLPLIGENPNDALSQVKAEIYPEEFSKKIYSIVAMRLVSYMQFDQDLRNIEIPFSALEHICNIYEPASKITNPNGLSSFLLLGTMSVVRLRNTEAEILKIRIDEIGSQIDEARSGAEKNIDNFVAAYETKINTQSIVNLWDQKAKNSLKSLWISGVLFIILLGTAVYYFLRVAGYVVGDLTKMGDNQRYIITLELIIPVLAAIWVLRHISRIFVHSYASYADAVHRGAVAQTYLGLLAETPPGVSKDERHIALQALFRPGAGEAPDNDPSLPSLLDALRSKA